MKRQTQKKTEYPFALRPASREEAGLFAAKRSETMQYRPIGRATFANGEQREYHDPQTYLAAIRQELPYRDVTGFRYETLTDDPAVRKQVDDILFDLYGEENPHSLADYENNPGQNMNMGGM